METKTFALQYTKQESPPSAGAIVVAAGSSSRLGGRDKLLLPLLGVPVIIRALTAFQNHTAVESIVVVANGKNIADIQKLVAQYHLDKVCDIVTGGASRAESVRAGFKRLRSNAKLQTVLIHDGARPLVAPDVIDRVLALCDARLAAAPAVPLKDTVKRVDATGKITETLERSALCAMQTPQCFAMDAYADALEQAGDALPSFTDDCAVLEHAGYHVYTAAGDYKNIKITTPEDIAVAEALLTVLD